MSLIIFTNRASSSMECRRLNVDVLSLRTCSSTDRMTVVRQCDQIRLQAPYNIPMNPACIREVWATNLEQEFSAIRRTIEDYPYIAMVSSIRSNNRLQVTKSNPL